MPRRSSVKPETVRSDALPERRLDSIDRKILGELAVDATLRYAELAERVHLSSAAVHERVRRLRTDGTIRRTVALLDGARIGKPLLAFVHLETAGWGKSPELLALRELPEIEEMHSVTGERCMLLKVRVADSRALESLLEQLYRIEGVRRTTTDVVLSTQLERPPQAGMTEALSSARDAPAPPAADLRPRA